MVKLRNKSRSLSCFLQWSKYSLNIIKMASNLQQIVFNFDGQNLDEILLLKSHKIQVSKLFFFLLGNGQNFRLNMCRSNRVVKWSKYAFKTCNITNL